MDTVNSTINRHFSSLSSYRLYQNASIWEDVIEDVRLNYKYDSFQSIPNTEELQYYTVKSEHHAFNQIKETLSVFNHMDFSEWRFRLTARKRERRTLLLLIDHLDMLNIDMLDEFIKNSSDELRRDFNWLRKDNEFYNITHDKRPQYKYRDSEIELRNRVSRDDSLYTMINTSPFDTTFGKRVFFCNPF